ncbi:hypothetical protein NQZ68_012029 [Dissostichus eleginoides]|nr:hypothetical protein NQZ68_012029 [Dissostichus eleginoides]
MDVPLSTDVMSRLFSELDNILPAAFQYANKQLTWLLDKAPLGIPLQCAQQEQTFTKGERENCSQENETSRTLPKASRAASQQIGAVGTNTRASVTRTTHTNIRGRTQE